MSIGIDIGSKTIKIVELAKEGQGYALKASGVVGYTGVSPDKFVDDKEAIALAEVIKKLHKEARISGNEVNVSLPEQLVFTRTIKFPLLTDQEIAQAVKWEAEQYIPIPINEAIVQHQIIEKRENASPPEVVVLLVAAPKEIVEKYIKVLQMAGLNPVGVETELMALSRALAPVNATSLILDFGARSTDIAIAKKGQLVFSRSIPTAGDAFTRAVAQSLGVEYQRAEEYKKAYGMAGGQLEGKIKIALDPIFRMVIDEVKKAIHFYQTEEKGEMPSSIILSGGTSGMPEAISLFTQNINIETVLGNPFARIAMDPQVAKTLAAYAPLYSIAVGLALRGE
jgi:type IV pilus assembly protein PilM